MSSYLYLCEHLIFLCEAHGKLDKVRTINFYCEGNIHFPFMHGTQKRKTHVLQRNFTFNRRMKMRQQSALKMGFCYYIEPLPQNYDYSFVFIQLSEKILKLHLNVERMKQWTLQQKIQSNNVYYKEPCVGRLHRTCQRLISTFWLSDFI